MLVICSAGAGGGPTLGKQSDSNMIATEPEDQNLAVLVLSDPTLCLVMDDLGTFKVQQWISVAMACRATNDTWARRCWRPALSAFPPHADPIGIRNCYNFLRILMDPEARDIPGWPAGTARSILVPPRGQLRLWKRMQAFNMRVFPASMERFADVAYQSTGRFFI